jgi:hypothetical protein
VVAQALGLDPVKVKAQVDEQMKAMAAQRAARFGSPDSAGGGWRRGAGAAAGDSGRGRWRAQSGRGGADSTRGGRRGGGRGAGGGGGGARGAGGAGGGGAGGGAGRASRAQVAFVKTASGLEPRVVRLGLSDFDYAEVVDGLKLGEQVVLLGVAEAQATRAQTQSRLRERMGSGVPGVPGGGAGGGGGGRGGGGGGGRGGP